MEKGENFKRKNRPTMQQLQYLTELEKMGKKRGCVALIAEICGVNHGSVSRYLKSCHENGYLTKDYEFTELGRAWFGGYRKLVDELAVYLQSIGIAKKEVAENVKELIENVDYYVLTSMIRSHQERNRVYSADKKELVAKNFLGQVLEHGNFDVQFMLYRMDDQKGLGISMANRGFSKPAHLRHNKRADWLELGICEMSANSRVDGEEMAGHLEALKYEQNGMLHQADVRDGSIRIPLEACRFQKRRGGEIVGRIPVTVTCSVGRTHMPESTALLVFWL